MATILLVHHASVDGCDRVLWGRSSVSLNQDGIREAEQLGKALAPLAIEDIVSSPQLRARQTALAIGRQVGLTVRTDPDFDEFNFGEWTGKCFSELETDPRWRLFNQRRQCAVAPSGESTAQVQARAQRALIRCAGYDKGVILVVTHAEIVRLLVLGSIGLDANDWCRVPVAPASLSVLCGETPSFSVRVANLPPHAVTQHVGQI
jgi:probable phosphoglycerate mutase